MALLRFPIGIATLTALAVLGAFTTLAVRAQPAEWPTKPLRVVIAGTPGSSSDQFVRAIEPYLQKNLGQTLWVDAKPGAGGMVAAEIVARAAPDGYTLFVSNVATNGISVSLYKRVPFDPQKDLPGAARIATMPNALAVRAEESGLPDFELLSWFGLSFASGTPRPIIERLGTEVVAALKDPGVRKRIEQLGAEADPLGPSEYDTFVRADAAKWASIVRASGARAD